MTRSVRENNTWLQIRLPKELHRRLMALGVDGGVSLLVRELLRKEIDKLEQKTRRGA